MAPAPTAAPTATPPSAYRDPDRPTPIGIAGIIRIIGVARVIGVVGVRVTWVCRRIILRRGGLRRRSKSKHGGRQNCPGESGAPEPVLLGVNEHSDLPGCRRLLRTCYMYTPFHLSASPLAFAKEKVTNVTSYHAAAHKEARSSGQLPQLPPLVRVFAMPADAAATDISFKALASVPDHRIVQDR